MSDVPRTPRTMGDTDAPHHSPITPGEDIRTVVINQISWSAVMAGVVTALAIHIVLNLLGIGVGAAALDPRSADNPDAEAFSGAAALWWTVSGVLASLLGGYVAGRTSGKPKESTAGYHGLAAWATTTLVIFVMIAGSLGTVVGGIYGTISGVVEQTSDDAAQGAATTPNPVGELKNRIQQMTGQDPANPNPETKQQATAAADAATTAVSLAGIFSALALMAGALAAWVGGRMGAVEPTLTSGFLSRERIT